MPIVKQKTVWGSKRKKIRTSARSPATKNLNSDSDKTFSTMQIHILLAHTIHVITLYSTSVQGFSKRLWFSLSTILVAI